VSSCAVSGSAMASSNIGKVIQSSILFMSGGLKNDAVKIFIFFIFAANNYL
jgi:hypothetical protein